jgi:hypothetical protein
VHLTDRVREGSDEPQRLLGAHLEGDTGEIRGDTGEIQGRYRGDTWEMRLNVSSGLA